MTFETLLNSNGPILIDGGLATQCEAMGCSIGGDLWSAELLQSNPRVLVDAHRAYLDAGARIIISASYQASRIGFMLHGLTEKQADSLIVASVDLAVQARDEYLHDNPSSDSPLIAASIGPYGAVMHDGTEYTGAYDVSRSELEEFHGLRLELLDQSDADLLACETIPSFEEAQILAEMLRDARSPAWVSFSCRDELSIGDGTAVADAVSLFRDHPRVLAVGINCTAPQYTLSLINTIKTAVPDRSTVVYPNSGERYDAVSKTWSGNVTTDDWARSARQWADAGANLIGGCCRTGPAQIRAIANVL